MTLERPPAPNSAQPSAVRELADRLARAARVGERPSARRAALKVALGYAALGMAWILITDQIVGAVLGDSASALAAQTVKGLVYILLSATFVYWLALRAVRETRRSLEFDQSQISQSVLDGILASLGEAVFIVDPRERMIVHCNPAAEQMFGYERGELVGRSTELLHTSRESYERFATLSQPALVEHRFFRTQYRMKRKDGKVLDTENTVTPLDAELGWERGVVSVVRDVSERLALESHVRQAQKMESVGRLAGGVAHDFNNLLGVVMGGAELALAALPPDHEARRDLQEIRAAGERGANLTRQLLAFARKQEVSPERLDLREAVDGMVEMLKRLIPADIDLQVAALGEEPPVIKMDPGQLDQVLANLVVNARDAMPEGDGTILIETGVRAYDALFAEQHPECRPVAHALLRVSDDGVGMDESTVSRAFEPFFTTKGQGRGTGLGLATVYGIVKQNHGFVDVASAPGKGTALSILLPLTDEPVAPAEPAGATAPAREIGARTILLVEDEPALLALLTRVLERLGHQVLPAGDAEEALARAGRHVGTIHLLITDIVLPTRTGRELHAELRARRPDIECLFMSGYSADIIAHRGIVESDVNLLTKPFTVESLESKLRELLKEE